MKINPDIRVIIFTTKTVNSSQDFGGNKYSKNNKNSDPLVNNKIYHETLEGISTA